MKLTTAQYIASLVKIQDQNTALLKRATQGIRRGDAPDDPIDEQLITDLHKMTTEATKNIHGLGITHEQAMKELSSFIVAQMMKILDNQRKNH